jgi:predicted permease
VAIFLELRRIIRSYLRRPSYPCLVVLVLALAIGASTAVFSMLNALLFHPLLFKDPARLVAVYEEAPDEGKLALGIAPDNFALVRDQGEIFEGAAAFVPPANTQGSVIALRTGDYKSVRCAVVSSNFFALLGVAPILGRGFRTAEDVRGGPRVAVLSSPLWRQVFGADPASLGKGLTLNHKVYTVIGVMPQGFEFPDRTELWLPGPEQRFSSAVNLISPVSSALNMIARLKSGITPERAGSMLATLAPRLDTYWAYRDQGIALRVVPLRQDLEGDRKQALSFLLGADLLVLLIGCVNVAHLALVRAMARRKEYAVRYAFGARRWQVIRPLMSESLLLATTGGLAGLALASSTTRIFQGLVPQNLAPPYYLDGAVFAFAFALSLVSGIALGLIPAFGASRLDLNRTLKHGGGYDGGTADRRGGGSLFVMSEVALAYLVLLAAGLMIKSLYRIVTQPLGFDPKNLVTAEMTPRPEIVTSSQHSYAFYRNLLDKMAGMPGFIGAAVTDSLPITGDSHQNLLTQVEGHPAPIPGKEPMVEVASVSPDYFRVMGISLLQGRSFTTEDSDSANRVAIIDQAFERRYWPGEEAIGKHLTVDGEPRRVVGAVAHVRQAGYFKDSGPMIYIPYTQSPPQLRMTLVLRSAKPQGGLEPEIRKSALAASKGVDMTDLRYFQQAASGTVALPRLKAFLLAGFAALALLLAALGTYGVMAHSVSHRMREIGVRMAMGARPGDVFRMVLGWGARLALVGAGFGVITAFALIPFLHSVFYGLSPVDPMIFASVSLLLLLATMLGASFPALRAAAVSPLEILREE